MESGQSKEELEMYWHNSRQYFDELANHYKTADPEYYRTHFKPFYDNPFHSISSGGGAKKSGGTKAFIALSVLLLIITGLGGLIFYFISNSGNDVFDNDIFDKKPLQTEEKTTDTEKQGSNEFEKIENGKDSVDSMDSEDHFIIGSKKIGDKDYDKAEYHLKQIKKGDKYYEQSQQLLKSLKYLRKYNK